MADISPFRGIRYRDDIVLDDVVAPPYDVLSAAQAAELRARSPYNAVHVDLPVPPGAAADEEAYLRAAATFRTWRDDGALVRDELPGIVVVDQTYTGPDGRERTRRGFIARLRLADLDERVVLPHERTHAGPKVDRLRLYRATHADVSQIFVLFPDDDGAVGAQLEAAVTEIPAAAWRTARDGDGNRHAAAALAGPAAERVAEALRDRPLYIADGHHRYETALAYRDERRAAGRLQRRHHDGLPVQPVRPRAHRLPHAPAGARHPAADARARSWSTCARSSRSSASPRPARRPAGPCSRRCRSRPTPAGSSACTSRGEETCLTVRTREPAASERLAAGGFSPAAAGLSVTLLHELLLSEALGLGHDDAERHVDYAKSVPGRARRAAVGTVRTRRLPQRDPGRPGARHRRPG